MQYIHNQCAGNKWKDATHHSKSDDAQKSAAIKRVPYHVHTQHYLLIVKFTGLLFCVLGCITFEKNLLEILF